MSNVRTSFVSDDKDVVTALQRMQAETVKLREENRRLKEESKSGGRESKKATDDATFSLSGQLKGITAVSAATMVLKQTVGQVQQAYAEWRTEMSRLATESTKFHENLIGDLGRSGDLMQSGRIKQFVGSLKGVKREEGAAAFGGVRDALPRAELARVEQITAEVARAAPVANPAELRKLGTTAGTIAELFPQMNARETANLAFSARADVGKNRDQLSSPAFERVMQSFTKAGMAPQEALATVTSSINAGVEIGNLAGLSSKLDADIEHVVAPRGGVLTPDQQTQNRLASVKGAERWKLIMQDEQARRQYAGDDTAVALGRVNQDDVAAMASDYMRAGPTDRLGRTVRVAESQNRGHFRLRDIEVDREKQEQANDVIASRDARAEATLAADLADKGMVQRFAKKSVFTLGRMAGSIGESMGLVDNVTANDMALEAAGVGGKGFGLGDLVPGIRGVAGAMSGSSEFAQTERLMQESNRIQTEQLELLREGRRAGRADRALGGANAGGP